MINFKTLKDQKGVALPVVLVVMLLLLALGAAAMMMSNLGYSHLASETKYQYADKAAEAGIKAAIADKIIPNAQCPQTGTGSVGGATYSYVGIPDSNDTYCFLRAEGIFSGAKVVKTSVVPRAGSEWAAMVARGCTIVLDGSSGIAGCDDDESTYPDRCGVVTALINESATVNSSTNPETITVCKNEGTIKGLDGNPPEQITSKPFNEGLTNIYFGVPTWGDILSKIETHYSNTASPNYRKIEFYDSAKTAAQKFGLPIGNVTAPGTVPNSCTFNSNDSKRCCKTYISGGVSYIWCDNNDCKDTPTTTACNGTATSCRMNLSETIQNGGCRQTQTEDNERDNYPYIAKDDNTVAFVSLNAPLQVATSGHRIALVTNDNVTITAAVNNIRIYTGGNVIIDKPLSATAGDLGSIIYAGGSVIINDNVGNHGSPPDTCPSTFNAATHIISGNKGTTDRVSIPESVTIRNTNIFTDKILVTGKPNIEGGVAKVFYALTGIEIDMNGTPCIGYPCKNDDRLLPVLFLVGDGNPATSGSYFRLPNQAGGPVISGMLFTDANDLTMKGSVQFQGTIINMSTQCNISAIGNAVIQFNKRVLDGVYNQLCSTIIKQPRCGAGNKGDYLTNTKVTVY